MNLSYEKQMIIAIAQSIIQKYGAVLSESDMGDLIGFTKHTIAVKNMNLDRDMPRYTQLRGKRVFMASDIAEWMVSNNLKFPK